MTRRFLLFIWTILCVYSILTEAQNVTTISTSNSTTTTYALPQYTVKAQMVLTFGSYVFISAYNNNASAEYLSFTNDIRTKMTNALMFFGFQKIEMIFNSIRNGSVIVDTQVTTAFTLPLSDRAAVYYFQVAVAKEYGPNVTSTVNITQSSEMILPTFAPTQYTTKAQMVLTFTTYVFISAYNNNASAEYLSFTNDIKTKMTSALMLYRFQIIDMIFNSIRNGSVIVDTQVTTASISPLSDTAAVYYFQGAVAYAYGPNVTSTVNITQSSEMFLPTFAPPQFVEYTTKAQMVLTFGSYVFISAYNNNASAEYLSFTNDIKTKMTSALQIYRIRLIEIIFNSIRNGSVIVDTQVTTASISPLSVFIFQGAVAYAYGPNVTSTVNITQSSSIVTTTVAPPKPGEYTVKAQLVLNFTSGIFISVYNNNSSPEYLSFTNDIKSKMTNVFQYFGFRLIEMIFNSIRNGSVIVDTQVTSASNVFLNDTTAASYLQYAVSFVYGPNVTSTVNITQSSSIVTSNTPPSSSAVTNTNVPLTTTTVPPTTTTTVPPITTITVPQTTTSTVPQTTTNTIPPTTTTTVPPTTTTIVPPTTTTTIPPTTTTTVSPTTTTTVPPTTTTTVPPTTTTTVPSTTTTTVPPTTITTVAPAKPGEYTVKARMGLTFGSGVFISAYANTSSPESLSFTNDIFNKMQNTLLAQAIRLLEIIIISIRSGSIIVDMQVTTASASAQTDAVAVSALQNAVTSAYGANVTSTVNITQSSSIVTNTNVPLTTTTVPPTTTTTVPPITTITYPQTTTTTVPQTTTTTVPATTNTTVPPTTTITVPPTTTTTIPPTTTTTVPPTTTTTVPPTTTITVPPTTTITVRPTTTTTVPPTTTITVRPTTITTVAPAKPGEYTVKAKMGLTFGSGVFISAYANTSSPESLSFTNDIFNKMQSALQIQSIRLTEMIINSIRNGSIIVDMQVTTASASAQTDAAAVNALQNAVSSAYGGNVTSTVNITQSSPIDPAPPSVTIKPTSTGSTVMFSIIPIITIGFSVLMMEIGK